MVQVTYPYIMAKVRIQARSADVDEATEKGLPPPLNGYHHDKYKHAGALDILARVWKREGFVGWYQVSFISFTSITLFNIDLRGCKLR